MSASVPPEIAVVIPHYNDPDRLMRCLQALVSQAGEDVEIVVADNASTVDITHVRAAFSAVRFVVQPEKGAGPARNLGVAETTAPWIMFIDADCLLAPDWIAVGREIARADYVIGGRVDVFHETPPPQSGAEAFEQIFAFRMETYLERDAFLGAGNLITSRRLFDMVGGFLPAVAEDKEWSRRAAAAGFVLGFENRLAVGHPSRQDWEALRRKWERLSAEAFLLERQEDGGRVKWAIKALLMLPSVLVHSPRILRAEGLTAQEKLRAWITLLRIRMARMIWMLHQAMTGKA